MAWSKAGGRPPREPLARRRVIWSLRSGLVNATRRRRSAGRGVGVSLVGQHPLRSGAWSAGSVSADRDLVEQGEQLRVVPGLSRSEDHRHRQAAAVDGEVDFAGQSASGSSEGFAVDGEVFDPVGGASPFLRAPAECWWARTELESILKVHSTLPTESSLTITSSRMRSQVPSAVQIRSRSWAVFHGP